MAVGGLVDPVQDVAEVLDRIHAEPGARDDQRVEKRELLPRILTMNEEEVLSTERDDAKRVLSSIVIERNARIPKRSRKLTLIPPGIPSRSAEECFRSVGRDQPATET